MTSLLARDTIAAAERLKVRADVIDLRYPNGFAMRVARAGEGKK